MTSLLILAFLAQDTNAFFPNKGGKSGWKLEELGEAKARVVHLSDKGAKFKPVEGKNWRVLRGVGLVEFAGGEVRFYREWMDNLYARQWTIRTDLKAGLKWKAETVYLSCGFGSDEETYEAFADQVEGGDAIRVDISQEGVVHTSLWFARGRGLIKK